MEKIVRALLVCMLAGVASACTARMQVPAVVSVEVDTDEPSHDVYDYPYYVDRGIYHYYRPYDRVVVYRSRTVLLRPILIPERRHKTQTVIIRDDRPHKKWRREHQHDDRDRRRNEHRRDSHRRH